MLMISQMAADDDVSNLIGAEINAALDVSSNDLDSRLFHLARAEEMILNQESTSLLDNFLDEMLEFMLQRDVKIRCFSISFIEKACKKDPDVMKRAIQMLKWPMDQPDIGIAVQKKVVSTCTQLYPVILRWVFQRKSDQAVSRCWDSFCMLKKRFLTMLQSGNEGFRTMALKFMEMMVLCQSSKTEFSETPKSSAALVTLDDISRDHTFISYRMLASEAQHCFNQLVDQLSSPHISSLNLVTVIACVCNIMRQRPEYFPQVISALESLHVNLPPTLSTSQVKSVRKELKMHLLRLLKHPASFDLHNRITLLLYELGATKSEINRASPPAGEINEALKRRVAAASASAIASNNFAAAGASMSAARGRAAHQLGAELDLLPAKRLRLEDDEYDDQATDVLRKLDVDADSSANFMQRAFDIATDFVYERLSLVVVAKLVIVSLYTLPDQMPSAFASSYTPIDEAGSEAQKRHLARMLAIQLTNEGEGPGVEFIKHEKQKLFIARQAARSEGAAIPPTPFNDRSAVEPTRKDLFNEPKLPGATKARTRPQGFSLFSVTRELLSKEAEAMFVSAFQRIMASEKRVMQGGACLAQQKLLVRLATRFDSVQAKEVEALLLSYVIEDQKNRTELALLWLSELYAQLQGFTICLPNDDKALELSAEDRYLRYDTLLCNFLSTLYERGEHKETLFHRIFLEVPLITPSAISILKMACVDKVYGAFAMTTLRELILTRARQRRELLTLLLQFSYFKRDDIKEHCVLTAKELYQIDYIRDDVRSFVIQMSQHLMQPSAPKVLWHRNGRMDKKTEDEMNEMPWDESLIRTGLHLFLALLPHDHSLLHQLAIVCARSNTEIKRVTFRCIDQAIKAIGVQSRELLSMIENCPEGAETLVARVVHLLTERSPPTPELVDRVRKLHQCRNTDVRSLIPILSGLEKDELRELIPKFVLSATNGKSVPAFFKKLMFDRHIMTHELLLTPVELIEELHRIQTTNIKEYSHLISNVDLLIVDSVRDFGLVPQVFAVAIEELIRKQLLSPLFFHTLQRMHEHLPALRSFLSKVFVKVKQREDSWRDDRAELWSAYLKCAKVLSADAYLAVISHLSLKEFKDYVEIAAQPDLISALYCYVSTLPPHQQSSLSKEVLEYVRGKIQEKRTH